MSSQWQGYMYQLLAEYQTGYSDDDIQTEWMRRGLELEDSALGLYSFINNVQIETVGLIYRDSRKLVAGSPDALIRGQKKGIEAKCPKSKKHIEYTLGGKLPTKHIPQVQGLLYVTGYDTWDFMSYHPDLKPFIITVERDEKYLEIMDELIEQFLEKLIANREKLAA